MQSEYLLPISGSVTVVRPGTGDEASMGSTGDASSMSASGHTSSVEAGATLEFQNLNLLLGEQDILSGFSLSLQPGHITCVSGPSGCGKSSLLRSCLALLLRSGLRVGGIGVSFQQPRLLGHRSVWENLALIAQAGGLTAEESNARIRGVVGLVGLQDTASRLASRLSGGMAQRLSLARALLLHPPVLLLDEPFAHLDLARKASLGVRIRSNARASGQAVLLITHDLYDAVVLGDRILFVDGPPLRIRSASEPDLSEEERSWTGSAVAGIHRGLVLQSLDRIPETETSDGSVQPAGSPPESSAP